MKAIISLALLAIASASFESLDARFDAWKRSYGRTYSAEEHETRKNNFKMNSMKVMTMNAAHAHIPSGAYFKLNKYADWSESELARLRGVKGAHPNWRNATKTGSVSASLLAAAPASINWVDKGVVAPVQDQGQCGSCWAFSATAALESQAAIKAGGSPQKLSEQFLVDCDQQCGQYRMENGCDAGCNGGLQPNAWVYTKSVNGQPSETAYPYTGTGGTCQSGNRPITTLQSWEFAPQDETQIAAYVAANGPVSVAVDASNWSFYQGGVMSSTSVCPTGAGWDTLDHGVAIVGYGTDSGTPYWIIRNSWNADWGESGYCRILRGSGFCGVQLFACRPLV